MERASIDYKLKCPECSDCKEVEELVEKMISELPNGDIQSKIDVRCSESKETNCRIVNLDLSYLDGDNTWKPLRYRISRVPCPLATENIKK